MNVETKDIYSETYQILNLLGNEYINKLPIRIFNIMKEKRNFNYNPVYSLEKPLNEQNVKKETISMIALLHLNYWCESEEEKNKLIVLFKSNEEKHEKKIRELYNQDNIFQNNKSRLEIKSDIVEKETSIIEYKESFFKNVIRKILNIFRIK